MTSTVKFFLFCLVFAGVVIAPVPVFASSTADEARPAGPHEARMEQGGRHEEESHAGGHDDPVAPVLLGIVVIFIAAKFGGELFEKYNQPAVLGELVFGVVVGNLHLAGIPWFTWIAGNDHIDILSRLGVIILLFMVGLESNIKDMLRVGVPSLMVALAGVVAPFLLGFMASRLFLAGAGMNTHLFIGAALTATSVGITARVFKDLGKLHLPEAKIILGAAVIDDILGLIVLAVVSGIIATGTVSLFSIGVISAKALFFLLGAILVGTYAAPWIGRFIARMCVDGMKIITVLTFAFFVSYLANWMGLATIVGAFAAGLVLDDVHFKHCVRRNHHGEQVPEMSVDDIIRPISLFLVPIFFVLMGAQVKLETFLEPSVLGVAAALTAAAIIGKQVCGLMVRRKFDRLTIGLGMIPRGEVGLIFAAIGKSLGVVDDALFSAIVIMVIITTIATPAALKPALERLAKKRPGV